MIVLSTQGFCLECKDQGTGTGGPADDSISSKTKPRYWGIGGKGRKEGAEEGDFQEYPVYS